MEAAQSWLTYVLLIGVWTALIYGVGRGLLGVIGRDSLARRVHGRYVLAWMLIGYLATVIGVTLSDSMNGKFEPLVTRSPSSAFVMIGYMTGMFAMLAGWAVGMIHGATVLCVWPPQENASSKRR